MSNIKTFAVIADIHFCDNHLSAINEGLRKHFYPYIMKNQKRLSALIIAGDLFHEKLSFNSASAYSVLEFLTKTLKLLKGVPLIIINGTRTHDFSQLNAFRFLEPKGLTIVDKYCEMEIDDVPVLLLPEEYQKNWEKYYNFIGTDDKYGLVILHGMIDFASYSSAKMESEKEVPSAIVWPNKLLKKLGIVTIAGHVHIPMDYDNLHYCGSFSRFCFGEEEPKGFVEVSIDLDDESYELRRIENTKAPTYKTIPLSSIHKGDGTDDLDKIMLSIKDLQKKFDHVRLEIDVEASERLTTDVALIRETFGSSLKIKITRIRQKNIEEQIPDEVVKILHTKTDVKQTITELVKQNYPDMSISEEYVGYVIGKA